MHRQRLRPMCYICLLRDRRLSMPQLKGGGRRRRRNNAGLLPSSGGHTRFWGLPLISVTGAETLRAGKLIAGDDPENRSQLVFPKASRGAVPGRVGRLYRRSSGACCLHVDVLLISSPARLTA